MGEAPPCCTTHSGKNWCHLRANSWAEAIICTEGGQNSPALEKRSLGHVLETA